MTDHGAGLSRRNVFAGAGAAIALAGCANTTPADLVPQSVGIALAPNPAVDPAVFNLALNLEYLEAEYYLRGLTGQGLAAADIGERPGEVIGGRRVTFNNPMYRAFVEELAADETAHTRLIRDTLKGAAVSRPVIDFNTAFAFVAQATGMTGRFDPFADETSFLLGSMLFEDVGVSAYIGAAPLVSSKELLAAAAGVLASEGYHSGMIRSVLYRMGPQVWTAANAISTARDNLDGPEMKDQGIANGERANFVATDSEGKCFGRTPEQVLRVVYLTDRSGVSRGGFFPNSVNGIVNKT